MQAPAPPRIRSFGQGLLFTALLCLLTMPVEYRGGGGQTHPHASLQFWTEAAGGSLIHHHDGSHRQESRESSHQEIAYRIPGDQEAPSLTTAAVSQKYAPVAIAGAVGSYAVIPGARASRSLLIHAGATGENPAPTTPPPRFAAAAI